MLPPGDRLHRGLFRCRGDLLGALLPQDGQRPRWWPCERGRCQRLSDAHHRRSPPPCRLHLRHTPARGILPGVLRGGDPANPPLPRPCQFGRLQASPPPVLLRDPQGCRSHHHRFRRVHNPRRGPRGRCGAPLSDGWRHGDPARRLHQCPGEHPSWGRGSVP